MTDAQFLKGLTTRLKKRTRFEITRNEFATLKHLAGGIFIEFQRAEYACDTTGCKCFELRHDEAERAVAQAETRIAAKVAKKLEVS